jgi:hypothetical protein
VNQGAVSDVRGQTGSEGQQQHGMRKVFIRFRATKPTNHRPCTGPVHRWLPMSHSTRHSAVSPKFSQKNQQILRIDRTWGHTLHLVQAQLCVAVDPIEDGEQEQKVLRADIPVSGQVSGAHARRAFISLEHCASCRCVRVQVSTASSASCTCCRCQRRV